MIQTFRSRDEQVEELTHNLREGHPQAYRATMALVHLKEAEARGAAEERGKYVEGQEPVGYLVTEHSGDGEQSATTFTKRPVSPEDMAEFQLTSFPVFERPTNVADLEARVKELEGAIDEAGKDSKRLGWLWKEVEVYLLPEIKSSLIKRLGMGITFNKSFRDVIDSAMEI